MDRKGWIMLILCGIGMMLTWKWMQDNNAANRELLDKQRIEKAADKDAPAKTEGGETTTPEGELKVVKPDVKTPEEKIDVLTVNDKDGEPLVEYTFTNKGGGVKLVTFKQAAESQDGPVVINKFGKYPIGALATDEGDIDPLVYPEVEVSKNKITYSRTSKGVKIKKVWTLVKDEKSEEYKLRLNVLFKNVSNEENIKLKNYSLTSGVAAPLFQDEQANLCQWFYYQNGEYENGTDGEFTDGWLWGKAKAIDIRTVSNFEYFGVSNQFYTTIIQPKKPGSTLWITSDLVKLPSSEDDENRRVYTVGLSFEDSDLVKGVPQSFDFDFYTGPRKQSDIVKLGANTDETMSYGIFGFGAPWANSVINWIHDVVADRIYQPWSWGIAIVILTICIRIVIWPLHNKSTRTMKRMSKLQPMMKEIREKHKDNPQKTQQETLKLYKKYKVNPMGGCLPMLVQMPIFFAVFGMLTNAVELRGAEFLWVADLSRQEALFMIPVINVPFNILPITMALTMVLQMRMTPSTGDKLQRRIFMLMPIMFFFFCYTYASALALYWTVQNIVSIFQTWLTQRLPEPELVEVEAKAEDDGKPRKKGFMERMAEKLEEAQNQREAMVAEKTGRPAPKKKASQNPNEKPQKEKKRSPKTGG